MPGEFGEETLKDDPAPTDTSSVRFLLQRAPSLPTPASAPSGDRGDVVLGWLVKLTATLGFLGLVAFDGLSIVMVSMTLEDQAVVSARQAVDGVQQTPTVQAAYLNAATAAIDADSLNRVDPADVVVAPDGSVTVTVHRTAATLVLQHFGPVRDWAERSASATAAPIR